MPIPRETDILVIGGGAIGSSVAYWLKHRNPNAVNVSVIERDPYVSFCSTNFCEYLFIYYLYISSCGG